MIKTLIVFLFPQTKSFFFFSRSNAEKALNLPVKFAMNRLRKFIFPIKLCKNNLLLGRSASRIALALFLSTSIPLLCTKKPRKWPAVIPKANFLDSSSSHATLFF